MANLWEHQKLHALTKKHPRKCCNDEMDIAIYPFFTQKTVLATFNFVPRFLSCRNIDIDITRSHSNQKQIALHCKPCDISCHPPPCNEWVLKIFIGVLVVVFPLSSIFVQQVVFTSDDHRSSYRGHEQHREDALYCDCLSR